MTSLQNFFFRTNGENWTRRNGWLLFSVDPCTSWQGIACNANHTHITQIFLPANNLQGTFPDNFFASFPQLNYFDVAFNRLTGPIPPLTPHAFVHFRVNNNELTGPLPAPPPVPQVYTNADFSLCPNYLAHSNNATWDQLVSFGQFVWWRDCDGIFVSDFND